MGLDERSLSSRSSRSVSVGNDDPVAQMNHPLRKILSIQERPLQSYGGIEAPWSSSVGTAISTRRLQSAREVAPFSVRYERWRGNGYGRGTYGVDQQLVSCHLRARPGA